MGGTGGMFFRNIIKDTWTKPRGGWDQGCEVEVAGVGGLVGIKWRQLCLNNNKNNNK